MFLLGFLNFGVHVDFDTVASLELVLFELFDCFLQSVYLLMVSLELLLKLLLVLTPVSELLIVLVDVYFYAVAFIHKVFLMVELFVFKFRDG